MFGPYDTFYNEEMEAEYNAKHDDHAERYAGSQLNPEYEAYCDSGCPTWQEWVASRGATPMPGPEPVLDYKPNHDNGIPF